MDFSYVWYLPILWIVLFNVVNGQECDTTKDEPQCLHEPETSLCKDNNCNKASACKTDDNCSDTPLYTCVADYCQPTTCTTTGECVNIQKCSQNRNYEKCVYPIMLQVEEKATILLNFIEPAPGESYAEITWSKNLTTNSAYRVVFLKPGSNGGVPLYGDEYCPGSGTCNVSTKVQLNVKTGELAIHNAEMSDEAFYYYYFYIKGGTSDTGHKYEIHVEVYVTPKEEDLMLTGIPDGHILVGTDLDLDCTVSRIKPQATDMYWMIGGRRENGALKRTPNGNGDTWKISNTLTYTVAREDEGKKIKCVVIPVYGNNVSVKQAINPGYGPSGKPGVEPSSLAKHLHQTVNLTCVNPVDDGNPDCDNYTWNRIEGSDGISLPASKELVFIMEESRAGHYTCTCGNNYNTSEVSDVAEVIFQAGPAPTPTPTTASSGVNMAIIGGAVGGAVVVILIVVIAIFLMRRRKKPPKPQPAEPVYAEMQQTSHSDDEMGRSPQRNGSAEPLYAQPSKRTLRPQRGIDHGPQYENAEKLRKESPYENTKIDNNNPPSTQENGNPDGVVYTEVNIGKDGKPRPKERNSIKKKVHQQEEPTVYAEIVPGGKSGETK